MSESPLSAARAALVAVLPQGTAAELHGQMRALQELAALTAAVQAEVTAAYVTCRRGEQLASGVPARRVGHGIAHEVALARRESPWRAERSVGFAAVLTRELPETHAALRSGVTSEWRATLIARETAWLSAEHRGVVDADLGPRLDGLGDRQVEAQAKRLAYTLDPHGLIRHIERAVGGRRVSLRPAPDGMTKLSATLPLAQGVATIAALQQAAASARSAGDDRTRGQVMADTLVERVTGLPDAAAVPITVNLIVTDQALLQTGPQQNEPATVNGYGPLPAPFVRDLVTRPGTPVEIRRLFTDPAGTLVTMETGRRAFTELQRHFVKLRDQWCQTPYCGAPIMQIDHIDPYARGGSTSLVNAQGLCEACNQAKADKIAEPSPPLMRRRRPPDLGYRCRGPIVSLSYRHRRRRSMRRSATSR